MMTDTETLDMLRDSARECATNEHPADLEHDAARTGGRDRWRAMADLGWTGAAIPEECGGLGLGVQAIGVIAEALGRELIASPLVSSGLVAAQALAGRSDLLAGIMAGETVVALAFDEGAHHGGALQSAAEPMANGWRLRASKRFVLDGADADWFLISARVAGVDQATASSLFLAPKATCQVTPIDTIDGRAMAHVQIDAVLPADALLDGGSNLIDRLGDLARLGLAAEMLGAAERMFEITLDYLKSREQFGRPIGSFQALQHRAAQMLVDIELARAALTEGLEGADAGDPALASKAALAKFMAGEVLHRVTNEGVQMHGGIGMTADHVAGRYLKWARPSEALFGGAPWLARRFAEAEGF